MVCAVAPATGPAWSSSITPTSGRAASTSRSSAARAWSQAAPVGACARGVNTPPGSRGPARPAARRAAHRTRRWACRRRSGPSPPAGRARAGSRDPPPPTRSPGRSHASNTRSTPSERPADHRQVRRVDAVGAELLGGQAAQARRDRRVAVQPGRGVTAGSAGSSSGSGLPTSRLRTPSGAVSASLGPIGGAPVMWVPGPPVAPGDPLLAQLPVGGGHGDRAQPKLGGQPSHRGQRRPGREPAVAQRDSTSRDISLAFRPCGSYCVSIKRLCTVT